MNPRRPPVTDDGPCVDCNTQGRVLDLAGRCHACWQAERERQDEPPTPAVEDEHRITVWSDTRYLADAYTVDQAAGLIARQIIG